MQSEPIAVGAAPSGSVSGLGVCDALRVELQPVQVPWLVDELEEMRGPLEETVRRIRADASAQCERAVADLATYEYELRLLRMMRAQLGAGQADEPTVFVGPAGLVGEAVRGAMRNAVGSLADLVHDRAVEQQAGREHLRATAEAAHAWVRTYLDLQAVVAFNFDPHAEPSQAW
jgi:hypothetical protein